MRWTSLVLTMAVLALILLGGCAASSATPAAAPHLLAEDVSLSLFQTVARGSYQDGTLSVVEVLPQLFFVVDGAVHLTGVMSTASFVDLWQQDAASYQAHPPQATLALATASGTRSVVLTLDAPALSGGALSFRAQVKAGELPPSFGPANLFIEAIPRAEARLLANAKVLGDAPAVAMGNLYQATAQALANAAHNAAGGQQAIIS